MMPTTASFLPYLLVLLFPRRGTGLPYLSGGTQLPSRRLAGWAAHGVAGRSGATRSVKVEQLMGQDEGLAAKIGRVGAGPA